MLDLSEKRVSNADPVSRSRDKALEKFGKKLKQLRNARGLTQDQLAELMQLEGNSQISQTENAKKWMSMGNILKAAAALGVPVTMLLSDVEWTDEEAEGVVNLFKIYAQKDKQEHNATLTMLRNNAKSLEK